MPQTPPSQLEEELARLRARVASLEAELIVRDTAVNVSDSCEDLDLLLDCRNVLDLMTDSVIIVDLSGQVLLWNKGAERLYGYTADHATGQHISLLYPPGEGDTVGKVIIPKAMAEGTFTSTRLLRHRSGQDLFVDVRLGLLKNRQGEAVGIIGCSNDATPRKIEEEGSLASILHCIPDGVTVVDRKGRFRVFNPAAELILGRGTVTHDPQQWSEAYELFRPDGVTPFPADELPLARGLRGETVREVEIAVRNPKTKSLRLISVSASPLRDGVGNIDGGIAVFRDITAQRRVELEREMTQYAVDQAADAMFWVRPNGRIHAANQAACQQLGYSREELKGMKVGEVNPTIDMRQWRETWQQFAAAGPVTAESRHRTRAGEIYPVEVSASLFRVHGKPMMCAIARDISQRKEDEKLLKESEERFRTTFEQAAVGICHVSTAGNFLRVNSKMCEILGYSREKLLKLTFQQITHPEDLAADLGQLNNMLDGSTDTYEMEKRYLRQDGSYVWGHLTVTLLRDEEGQPKYFISVVEDISVRKHAEEQLQLEDRLLRGLLELQERERRTISHEIHDGFLQYVVGADMVLESVIHSKPERCDEALPQLEKVLGYVRQAIEEGRRMIGDLRALIIDEAGVVEAITHLTSDDNFTQGLEVSFVHQVEFDRLDPMVETAIYRIVQEALTNVKRHAQVNHALVLLRQQGDTVRIEVIDKGQGFEPNSIPQDRFGVRGISQRARLFGGSGEVISAPGRGTRVIVELPISGNYGGSNGNGTGHARGNGRDLNIT